MDYVSAIARGRISQLSTYTAPCLGKVVHLEDLAIVTEGWMQFTRFEMDDLPNEDFWYV